MEIVKSSREMTARAITFQREGFSAGFVPTMGALHAGHLSLLERARVENDKTIVSIFVNPTQFGPLEDFRRYPRDIEGDLEKLEQAGTDHVFLPDVKDMYSEDYRTFVEVTGLADKLCGKFRPGHFRGVATVVTKLFHIVRPTRAYFGQKDYQQSLIIQALVRDLDMGIDIVVCPTVRESDGLAMSSRNAYLDENERKAAGALSKAMNEIARKIQKNAATDIPGEFKRIFSREPLISEVQYASAYDPVTLDELKNGSIKKGKALLAVAVKIGATRLIDNMLVEV